MVCFVVGIVIGGGRDAPHAVKAVKAVSGWGVPEH
jgi:hypothetical protein